MEPPTITSPAEPELSLANTLSNIPGITREKTRLGDTYIVSFDGPDDAYSPQNWPLSKKFLTSAAYAFACFTVSFASGVLSPATNAIAHRFDISSEVATLATSTLFLLGYVAGPFVWAPMSESQGRKMTLLISTAGFVCFGAGSATAKDYQTLCLCRFFQGVMGAGPISVTTSAYADMYNVFQRGYATTVFGFTVFSGPMLAAPLAGFTTMNASLGWRWCAWWTVILGSASLFGIVFTASETFAPFLLKQKAIQLRVKTGEWALHAAAENHYETTQQLLLSVLKRPFLVLAQEPVLMLVSLYTAFTYALIYTFLVAYDVVFIEGYHFNLGIGGLPLFGLMAGLGIAAIANLNQQRYYSRWTRQNQGVLIPEWRMPIAMTGAVAFPVGIFWFGWTAAYPQSIHWSVPTVSGLMTGYGILTIFLSFFTYIIDVYKTNSASAFAAATIVRSGLAAAFPLFTVQMYHNLGVGWATSLLGFLAVLLAPSPILFWIYGAQLRSRSKFAINTMPPKEATPTEKEGSQKEQTV